MNQEEYKRLVNQLQKPSDINKLAKEMRVNRELLLILYTHGIVRDATKRYYRVKNRSDKLMWQWKNGTPLLELAYREEFPPVLLSLILIMEMGHGRKEYWKFVKEPHKIKDARLRKEITDVVKDDIIYSPIGMEVQHERGRKGEDRLKNWLDNNLVSYRREDDIREEFRKTPDFLLDKPLYIGTDEIIWIESKANFGDKVEIRKNMKKQLVPYTEIFGKGIVVYWFGHVDDFEPERDVTVVDATFFHKDIHEL